MTSVNLEVYDALKSIGADNDTGRKAADALSTMLALMLAGVLSVIVKLYFWRRAPSISLGV